MGRGTFMKRLIAIIILSVMLLMVASCSGEKKEVPDKSSSVIDGGTSEGKKILFKDR